MEGSSKQMRKRLELLLGKAAVVGFLSMIGHPDAFGYEYPEIPAKEGGIPFAKIPSNWRLPLYWREENGHVRLLEMESANDLGSDSPVNTGIS
jgi:hypothetical protein